MPSVGAAVTQMRTDSPSNSRPVRLLRGVTRTATSPLGAGDFGFTLNDP
jgi:hypothetical protein